MFLLYVILVILVVRKVNEMGKALTVIIVLVFALAACALTACSAETSHQTSHEVGPEAAPDVAAPAETPEHEPVPGEPEPGLLNYKEWLELHPEDAPPFGVELDWLVFSNVRDDGYVTTAVVFPGQWPTKQFGIIPEYTGTGYMHEFFITHPNMSLRTEDIENVKLSIYGYKDEDINNYINNLPGFTPDEELAEEYYREKSESFPYVKSVRSFRKGEVVLNIVFAEEDTEVYLSSGKFVQFEAIYSRDAYRFDPEAGGPTELLNYFEFAEKMGFEVPAGISLDYLIDTYESSGMNFRQISAPSKWPRDAFGDLLPEYTEYGFLQNYEIATPQDDPSPESALLLSVGITPYNNVVDIDGYAYVLAYFGYYELPPEEYSEYQKGLADERGYIRVFCLPGHTVVLSASSVTGWATLNITLYFEGRRQNFLAAQASSEEQGAAQSSPPMA